jgi:hypothetical protein
VSEGTYSLIYSFNTVLSAKMNLSMCAECFRGDLKSVSLSFWFVQSACVKMVKRSSLDLYLVRLSKKPFSEQTPSELTKLETSVLCSANMAIDSASPHIFEKCFGTYVIVHCPIGSEIQ